MCINPISLFKFQIHSSALKSVSLLKFCNTEESVICLSQGRRMMSDYN